MSPNRFLEREHRGTEHSAARPSRRGHRRRARHRAHLPAGRHRRAGPPRPRPDGQARGVGGLHRPLGLRQVDPAARPRPARQRRRRHATCSAGHDVSDLDDNARAHLRNELLGFVFQLHNLLPRTSALENVATPLIYRGVRRAERLRRARRPSRRSAWPTAPTTTRASSRAARCSAWRSPAPWSATPRSCSSTSPPATSI